MFFWKRTFYCLLPVEKLLELKIEDTLRQIMNDKDQQQCYEEAKALLRDLGCQVELKELWAGTGKNLSA